MTGLLLLLVAGLITLCRLILLLLARRLLLILLVLLLLLLVFLGFCSGGTFTAGHSTSLGFYSHDLKYLTRLERGSG